MNTDLSLNDLLSRTLPPAPWAEGDNIPWDEPAFSERMLREHLSQEHDLASRRQATIEAQVQWLHQDLLRGTAGAILDLGCGPGLYAHRLARLGHRCVGVDFGPASVRHARAVAEAEGLDCTFHEQDLRAAELGEGFDLAMLIYGQLNVFRRDEASTLLRRAGRALAGGGRLLLEVQSPELIRGDGEATTSWSSAEAGLFSERPHLVLHERFWDPSLACSTERWHVVDAQTSRVSRYALTNETWSREALSEALREANFTGVEFLPTLPGSSNESPMFAVVASRS